MIQTIKTNNGMRTYNDSSQIIIIWSIEDVKSLRPDLTDEQCLDVLSIAERRHDANIGINWEVLELHASYLFPL